MVLNMEKSLTVTKIPQNLHFLLRAHGTLWLVNLSLIMGVHLGDTWCPFLRAVLRWDHLTHVRWIIMDPEQEEVGHWPDLHFQKVFWLLCKFTPIATISSHQGEIGKSRPYQTRWRFAALCSGTMNVCLPYVSIMTRDTAENPGERRSAPGVWLCPPRCSSQLLWLRMELKFCFIRFSDTLGNCFPLLSFHLRKKMERIEMFCLLSPSGNLKTLRDLEL